jgi:hypothetical protein
MEPITEEQITEIDIEAMFEKLDEYKDFLENRGQILSAIAGFIYPMAESKNFKIQDVLVYDLYRRVMNLFLSTQTEVALIECRQSFMRGVKS